jgi:5-methylcytosine-specific restriction protein A
MIKEPAAGMWEFDEEYRARERQKAKDLKRSRWWQNLIQQTVCYYCRTPIRREQVTMDHVVPISRGGKSTAGNIVPACKDCNEQKRSLTAVEWQSYLDGFKNHPPDILKETMPKPQETR